MRVTAVDLVINAIKRMLITGKIRAGELLPTEHSLAEMLQVSRGSVREAMKILDAYGIIDIRRGEGTFVCDKPSRFMFNPLLFQILVKDYEMTSLVEVRQIVEAGIMDLVIDHATDEEIAQLAQVQAEFEAEAAPHPGMSVQRMRALDIQFHRLTGQYCHNPIVASIYDFIIDLFEPSIDPARPGVIENHRGILDALRRRDKEAALEFLNRHTATWSVFKSIKAAATTTEEAHSRDE